MDLRQRAKELVGQMTLEEKASLCSGRDFWHTKGIERLGLPAVMVTDGPHGLRKQAGDADHLGINQSVPATCFPTASATACSFDTALMHDIGVALGEECQQEEVAVILGPGVNIKRSPLCGRNFEYVSEDPLLAGELAAALVQGVQSQGVGTSVKHYALNNQETRRMSSNSVADERTMREIYLAAYERIVEAAQPWTFMCSYNLINGTYASDDGWLLTQVLREQWGFEGLVMTDWGAADDRVQGVRAGLDLEMPASGGHNDAKIVAAVKNGSLEVAALDRSAQRLTELVLRAQQAAKPGYQYDADAHHALARRAAAESCVLLKNEGAVLPVAAGKTAAVIGAFAKAPRYQGTGSSKINPTRMDSAWDALSAAGLQAEYAEGYSLKPGSGPDEALMAEACKAAEGKDVVLLFAGLPDEYESEGFDRTHLDMPESHSRLIEAVAAVNPNTVVVLLLGAPVRTPWAEKVKAILVTYLGGQAGGGGCADVLLGKVCPGGKLAESWPLALEDTPCAKYFPGGEKSVEYREGVYVGYRYYDTAEKPVAWPFGFGLSYTRFEYSALEAAPDEDGGCTLRFTLKNTGAVAGAEAWQVYVGMAGGAVFRPKRQLQAFGKEMLQPGESRTVEVKLGRRAFAYYNAPAAGWAVEGGRYTLEVGASSRDIRLEAGLELAGDGKEGLLAGLREKAPVYWQLPRGPLVVDDAAFTALYGRPLPPSARVPGQAYTVNSTLGDIKDTRVGAQILKQVRENAGSVLGEGNSDITRMLDAMLMDMPLRALVMMSGGAMTPLQLEGIVNMLNGRMLRGMFQMWRGKK